MSLSSCLGSRRRARDEARQPLLPQYHHDTAREQRLHEKLHTYQMLRALGAGYMPSNEQLIINLRTLLASDLLSPDQSSLTDSGRLLVKHTKALINAFIDALQHKNSSEEIQYLIWCLAKSRVNVDVQDLAARASAAKSKANTAAAYQSVRTVGTLVLQNTDFRLFLADLQTIGREVFRDSALTASKVANDVGHQVEPAQGAADETAVEAVDSKAPPSKQQLAAGVDNVARTVKEGAAEVGEQTRRSAVEHLSGDEKRTLVKRLQSAVTDLRQRPNYSDSVSTLTTLLQRFASVYSRMLTDTLDTIADDTQENKEADEAVKNFGSFLKRFGDPQEWDVLQQKFERVLQHQQSSPDFERLIDEISKAVHKMLTDPSFYDNDNVQKELTRLRDESKQTEHGSPFTEDLESLISQIRRTASSVYADEDVTRILGIAHKILSILSPAQAAVNGDLFRDLLNVFGPLFINAIQHIPIPRLEVAVPGVDLLLENLIIEPGRTVNNTSFLPFRFRVESYNKVELRKTLTSAVSSTTSLFTIKIDGLSARADDLGYWLRKHKGIFRFADEGIASFRLDDRGIDVHLDVEAGKDHLENILSLRGVRVRIHHLNYTLLTSKFSWLATLFKPFIRPVIRKMAERQLASAIADFFHAANREIVFARERLRATRIADPGDLATFVKAVAARLKPADDPDVYTRLGVKQPGKGVFKGRYTPGSMVKVWEEEGRQARERIDDHERGGWRNDIFDVHYVPVANNVSE